MAVYMTKQDQEEAGHLAELLSQAHSDLKLFERRSAECRALIPLLEDRIAALEGN